MTRDAIISTKRRCWVRASSIHEFVVSRDGIWTRSLAVYFLVSMKLRLPHGGYSYSSCFTITLPCALYVIWNPANSLSESVWKAILVGPLVVMSGGWISPQTFIIWGESDEVPSCTDSKSYGQSSFFSKTNSWKVRVMSYPRPRSMSHTQFRLFG